MFVPSKTIDLGNLANLMHATFDFSNFRFLEPIFVSLGGSRNRDSTVISYNFSTVMTKNEQNSDDIIPFNGYSLDGEFIHLHSSNNRPLIG